MTECPRCGDGCTPGKGPKVQSRPCPACGRETVALFDGLCLDCAAASLPPRAPVDHRPVLVRLLEVLRDYASPRNWGRVNADRPASYYKGTSGPGWGPAARILESLDREGYIDPGEGA